MAIMDERTEFADATSVGTPNNSTVNVGDVIPLSVARDLGNGNPVYVNVQVTTSLGSGGAAFVDFQVVSDGTGTIATNGTQTVHWRSVNAAVATWAAGYTVSGMLPLEDPDYELYLAFQCRETAGQALNAGAVNAFLSLQPVGAVGTTWKAYPNAVD